MIHASSRLSSRFRKTRDPSISDGDRARSFLSTAVAIRRFPDDGATRRFREADRDPSFFSTTNAVDRIFFSTTTIAFATTTAIDLDLFFFSAKTAIKIGARGQVQLNLTSWAVHQFRQFTWM